MAERNNLPDHFTPDKHIWLHGKWLLMMFWWTVDMPSAISATRKWQHALKALICQAWPDLFGKTPFPVCASIKIIHLIFNTANGKHHCVVFESEWVIVIVFLSGSNPNGCVYVLGECVHGCLMAVWLCSRRVDNRHVKKSGCLFSEFTRSCSVFKAWVLCGVQQHTGTIDRTRCRVLYQYTCSLSICVLKLQYVILKRWCVSHMKH